MASESAARVVKPLRVGQVAERLGVDPRHVLRLIQRDRFPGAFRVDEGGSWRIPREDLEAHIRRHAVRR